jgi:CRP/FNR family transcriptional regulator
MSTLRSRPNSRVQGSEPCGSCGARQASICAALDDQDLRQLAALALPVPVAAGHSFIAEGDPAEYFFNVTAGTAKLFKLLPDGRRQITGFATTGTFLGLAVSATYAFGAEAVEPTRICRFSRHRLRHMLDAFPAMERRLLEVASNELVAAQEQMLLLGRKTARERVASFLVAWAKPAPGCVPSLPPPGEVRLPMARGDIADYLGLTVETVSRTFTRLKADRLIATPSPSAVVFRDHARLIAIAAGQA